MESISNVYGGNAEVRIKNEEVKRTDAMASLLLHSDL